MSYDPYAYGPDEPRPNEPYDSDRLPSAASDQIKGRVQAPAIALIVVGILNMLFALYMVFNSVVSTVMPADRLKESQKQIYDALPPAMRGDFDTKNADELKMQTLLINWPLTCFSLLASALPVVGGVRMLVLKNYALSICGAVVAMVPCISATACCGLGEIIGIWALVVLLNQDVRSAFR